MTNMRDLSKFKDPLDIVTTDPLDKPKRDLSKFTDYRDLESLQKDIIDAQTPANYYVGDTDIGKSQYDNEIPLSQIADLELVRAGRQSGSAKAFNAIVGGLGSGSVGVLENFSVLGDVIGNKLGLMEDFEKSTITENLQAGKDYINSLTPIYRKNRADTFDFSDSGFYFEMLKGAVDSAVAFGVAGAGYAGIASKISSMLGRTALTGTMGRLATMMGKGELAGQRLNVLTRFAGSKLGNPEIAKDITQFGAAFLSNYAEGTVMGLETYDTEKEKLMTVGTRNRINEIAQAQGIDPSEVQLSQDDLDEVENDAIEGAGKAGHMMRNLNHMLLGSNLFQMRSIAGLKGFIAGGGSSAARNEIKKAGAKQFWKNQAIGAPMEAMEEIGQNVIQMESKFQADKDAQANGLKFLDSELESTSNSLGQRIVEFATSDQALLEGMMGFISGPIQYGITQAPFQKGVAAETNKRYAAQQTLIGANAEFIKNKLKQTATGESLAKEFETYRDEVLGRDPSLDTPELQKQDAERFEKLIANTELDTLIQENFFKGTTADLESQLTEQAGKEPANEEEKLVVDNAKRALERLTTLETRFNNYNKYINGAEIFAADLRGERLAEISNQLTESFTNREKQMTMDIQAALEDEYQKLYGDAFDGELTNLNKNYILKSVGKSGKVEEGLNREVNSVTDIVEGIRKGYTLFNNNTGGKVLGTLDVVNKALMNKALLDNNKVLERENRLFVNEAKSMDYQTLYSNYVDAMNSLDENNVQDMGLVKTNLEEVLKDKRFTKGFKQLKTSIEAQIADINLKINQIQATDNSLAEETKKEVKAKSSEVAKTKAKGTPSALDAKLAGTTTPEAIVEVAKPATKTYPPISEAGIQVLSVPFDQRTGKAKDGKWINPDTNQAEPIHTLRVSPINSKLTEVSFPSNPTKFLPFMEDDGVDGARYIPTQKEIFEDKAKTPAYKKNDKIIYQGEKGWVVQDVLPDGKVKIKKDNRVITINPDKATNAVTVNPTITQKAVTKPSESKVPVNQIDNKKEAVQKPVSNNSKVSTDVEPVAVDPTASLISMKQQVVQRDTLENNNKKVDVITVGVNETTGEPIYESANVKTLDYNFNEDKDDDFAKFVRNKQIKEGEVVVLRIDTSNDALNIFKNKKAEVQKAIVIFNKLKEAKVKDLKNWQKVITQEEYTTLMNYLPVKFNLKSNTKVESYTQVLGPLQLKAAEKLLREDTINAVLSGRVLERQIKGQGPGALNEITPQKVSDFLSDNTKVDNAVLHVSIGGALIAVDDAHATMFEETMMQYTDGQGKTEGWDGVFTIAVRDMSGAMFPAKLNTLNHTADTANIVVSLLADLVNPKFKTAKGDIENNVLKSPLKTTNPTVYQWLENNMPSMLDVYGRDSILVEDALSDLIYYGDKTIGSFGHLSVKKGLVSIGTGNTLSQFSYADLQNPELRATLSKFIQEVKPFNVQTSKLRGTDKINKTAYRNHVFGNYMESSVNLTQPFVKVIGKNPSGNAIQRYERAHLYISALAPNVQAEQGTITPVPQGPSPEDLFAPDETTYKGLPLINRVFQNKAGHMGGAKYNKAEKTIYINEEILKQKYAEKAWTKPYTQPDGTVAEALAENAFTSYEQFKAFVIEHEFQHSVTSREQYNELMSWANSTGAYEDFINIKAAQALGIEIYKTIDPTPVAKVQTSSSIKPVETKVLDTTPEQTNLQEKEAKIMQDKIKEEQDKCNIKGGGAKPKGPVSDLSKLFKNNIKKK